MHVVVIQRVSREARAVQIFHDAFPGWASVPEPNQLAEFVGRGNDYQQGRAAIIEARKTAAPDDWWRHWTVLQAQS